MGLDDPNSRQITQNETDPDTAVSCLSDAIKQLPDVKY